MVASAGLEALEKVSVLKVPQSPTFQSAGWPSLRVSPVVRSANAPEVGFRGGTAREGVGVSGADFAVVAPQVDSGGPSQGLEAVVRREG